MGQRWQPPVAHWGFVQRASVGPPVASHRWASVGPPLGQRWLATGGPLLAHRWLATVGPTVGQRYTNDKCAVGPTVAATGGPLWVCPTSLCWPTGGYSHRWASVGPPLGQRWLATGGPLLAHRWLATVGPTVGQRYTNDKCAVGPTVAATGGPLWVCPTSLCWPTGGYSHRWASVGPPLGQRWLATGGPLLAHRWLATVGPTVGQRYTNDKCAVGPTMASHR